MSHVPQRFIYPVEFDRSNSTGPIRPASKTPLKRPKKQKLSLIWLHTSTIACCTSSNQNVARATTIYLPGRNRPVEFDRSNSTGLKNTFKTAQKKVLILIGLHMGTMLCCTSFNQNCTNTVNKLHHTGKY